MKNRNLKIEAADVYPHGKLYCIKVYDESRDKWVLITRTKNLDVAKRYATGIGTVVDVKETV